MTMRRVAALALALAGGNVHGAVILVGIGPGCQFATIQAGIDAAQANPGPDELRIANSGTYVGQGLTIGSQDLTVTGAYATCSDTVPGNGVAVISGQGTPSASVFRISGTGVKRLQSLIITRGDPGIFDSLSGGGIHVIGRSDVLLTKVDVIDNQASTGGGIALDALPSGQQGFLTLGDDVFVRNNVAAGSGGGIHAGRGWDVRMDGARSFISGNVAGASGGGIHAEGAVTLSIGSPGLGGIGALHENEAADGGGIAMLADAAGAPTLELYATRADRPPTLSLNRASSKGGALYTRGFASATAVQVALACIESGYIVLNRAIEGAAIYADTRFASGVPDAPSIVHFNQPALCDLSDQPAVPCTRNANGCNLIDRNIAVNSANVAQPGATVLVQTGSDFRARDVVFGSNSGAHVVRAVEARYIELENTLIAANPVFGPLLRLSFDDGPTLETFVLLNSTLTNNSIASPQAIRFENQPGQIRFNNNIVFHPGVAAVTYPAPIATAGARNWDFNATNAPQVLPAPWNTAVADPRFVDPARNDYRLNIGSPLVDRYPPMAAAPFVTDLDFRNRAVPIPIRARGTDTVDTGAYERQLADPWLPNGEFQVDLNLWTVLPNTGTTWLAQDAGAATGTGSVRIDATPAIEQGLLRITGLRRCFNLPGRGNYAISARGFRNGGFFPDAPVLRWVYRADSANCTGPATALGDSFFASGAGWRDLLAPAQVEVTEYNINASIEIRLDVVEGNPALAASTALSAGFDAVRIEAVAPGDDLFANGFESP